MKRLMLLIAIALPAGAKCQRSDAGPILQAALDVSCAVHWVGKHGAWLGRKIEHAAVFLVRGLD